MNIKSEIEVKEEPFEDNEEEDLDIKIEIGIKEEPFEDNNKEDLDRCFSAFGEKQSSSSNIKNEILIKVESINDVNQISNCGNSSKHKESQISQYKKTSHIWRESHVRALLSLWEDNYKRLNGSKKNSSVYREMASQLNNAFYLTLSGSDINLKITNLKKQYRLEKRKLSSRSAPSCWWPYKLVSKIIDYKCQPVNKSPSSDSMAEESQELSSADIAAPDENLTTAGPSGVGNTPEIQDLSSDQDLQEIQSDLDEGNYELSGIDLKIPHFNSIPCVEDKENGNNKRNRNFIDDGEENESESENKKRKLLKYNSKSKLSPSVRALLKYLDEERALRERELAIREKEIAVREANNNKFRSLIDVMTTYVEHMISKIDK